ncbi:MAG: hypothetical protein PSV17_09135 [Methylotenera sp.]|uniref:hypothetical protein n=1 Tax=Methylotenera sp. TaxID=2051956 RepID=UPI00248938FA|nr:hypothetical protein [Methylotenera sp.]MDI1309579.1 hypothetical protein [Methylotenera sp.]
MNRKATIIIGLQAALIVILFWFLIFYGKDEYEAATTNGEEEVETKTLVVDNHVNEKGVATLILPVASQQQSGIQTIKLHATQYQAVTASFGTVEAMSSLIEMRTRYLAALAEGNVTRSTMTSAEQNLQRLQLLNQDDKNVSDRAVLEAQAILNGEKAKLSTSATLANGIRDNMRQQWGATLANWATQTTSNPEFESLLQSQDVLLKISLPFDVTPSKNTTLQIVPMGSQTQVIKAQFISDAPQADSTLQGKTYFYRAPAGSLRAGMRVTTRLSTEGKASSGVIVPHEAVVWYANQAWVYQKIGADKFVRRRISTEVEIESEAISGWYNTSGLAVNNELVNSGAQLLLSEELKYQIKNENED